MKSSASQEPRAERVRREQARRRGILLGIGALLVFALTPLFSHHVVPGADAAFAGRSHLVVLCLVALHGLLAPVHGVFHGLFLGGLLFACRDRVRAALLARRTLAPLHVERPGEGDAFWHAARAGALHPDRLAIVTGLPAAAFTIGWWRPRVYIAREAADRLTPQQLGAVIAHEAEHVRRRDPLRLSLLRFVSCALFWIPAFRRLADDIAEEAEILADDAAATACQPLVLASAILEVAKGIPPRAAPAAATGFHRSDLVERRVRRLLGHDAEPSSHLTRRSVAGAALALSLVLASGAVVAHPLPDGRSRTDVLHCHDHEAAVVHHLFCLLDRDERSPAGCPHSAH